MGVKRAIKLAESPDCKWIEADEPFAEGVWPKRHELVVRQEAGRMVAEMPGQRMVQILEVLPEQKGPAPFGTGPLGFT